MSAISSMNVRTNIATQQAHRQMREVSAAQTNAARRLSTGYRINSAADDAAGVAISESMTTQIRGLEQASANANDGIGLIQTADGALQSIGDKLQRIRELIVQAANDTYVHEDGGRSDRAKIQGEIDELFKGVNDIAMRAEFNTKNLLDGTWMAEGTPSPGNPSGESAGTPDYAEVDSPPWIDPRQTVPVAEGQGNELHLQIGANSHQSMFVSIGGMNTHFLGLSGPGPDFQPFWIDVRQNNAQLVSAQIDRMDDALTYLNNVRANLGSQQVRLEHTRQALDVTAENLSDARSRIRDADMAREMMDFTQMNILFQTGISMMAHGQRLPETVLQLLQ